jgi:hypothetical protein
VIAIINLHVYKRRVLLSWYSTAIQTVRPSKQYGHPNKKCIKINTTEKFTQMVLTFRAETILYCRLHHHSNQGSSVPNDIIPKFVFQFFFLTEIQMNQIFEFPTHTTHHPPHSHTLQRNCCSCCRLLAITHLQRAQDSCWQ